MVQLSDELLQMVDRRAATVGLSRSALIRIALEQFLARDRERALTRAIVDGYRRLPPGTADEWGEMSKMSDQAATDVARRLDAEERGEGHEPW